MGSKTPITILQETMARQGTSPIYELIFDGGGTHTSVFKYKVHAHDVTAIGSGRSKKEAKHEAARIGLELLYLSPDKQPCDFLESVKVLTPYKDQLKEDAIGALHNVCSTHEIPKPEYKLIEEKGAPHDRMFSYICSVSKQREVGIGRTKKQAKQRSAYNMINKLRESLDDVLKDLELAQIVKPSGDTIEKAVTKYVAVVRTSHKKTRFNKRVCVFPNFFSEIQLKCQESAWEILSGMHLPIIYLDGKNSNVDWMVHLNKVLTTLDVHKSVIPGKSYSNGNQNTFLQINLSPEAVFYGSGCNLEQALQQASYRALIFLKIQMQQEKNKFGASI